MGIEAKNRFIWSWALTCFAIYLASKEFMIATGAIIGISVWLRSEVGIQIPPAIKLIDEIPGWKWVAAFYCCTVYLGNCLYE